MSLASAAMKRQRRQNTQLVNYVDAKELDAELSPPARAPGGAPRKGKTCPSCGTQVGNASARCKHCGHAFAIGGGGGGARPPALRTFGEEREDDGGRAVDRVVARRRARPGAGGVFGCWGAAPARAADAVFAYDYLCRHRGSSRTAWYSAERLGVASRRSKRALERYVAARDERGGASASSDDDDGGGGVERVVDCRVGGSDGGGSDGGGSDGGGRDGGGIDGGGRDGGGREAAGATAASAGAEPAEPAEPEPDVAPPAVGGGAAAAVAARRGDAARDGRRAARDAWRPLERCARVLERLRESPDAEAFDAPVPLAAAPGYDAVVANRADLGLVGRRLAAGDYGAPPGDGDAVRAFARDVRLVFSNCRRYNDAGSALWRVAVVLGMTFERLLDAWVLGCEPGPGVLDGFADAPAARYARPWEAGCRGCGVLDGALELCDHCDGEWHAACGRAPEAVAAATTGLAGAAAAAARAALAGGAARGADDGADWHCVACARRCALAGLRALPSARAEDRERRGAARAAAAEAREAAASRPAPPRSRGAVVEYLVKWRGRSYPECTWEAGVAAAAVDTFSSARPAAAAATEAAVRRAATARAALRGAALSSGQRALWRAQVEALRLVGGGGAAPAAALRAGAAAAGTTNGRAAAPALRSAARAVVAAVEARGAPRPAAAPRAADAVGVRAAQAAAARGAAAARAAAASAAARVAARAGLGAGPRAARGAGRPSLRGYQAAGAAWLAANAAAGRGSILADEMGLGKTAQVATFLDGALRRGGGGPCLVVAPLSTIGHWERELEAWTALPWASYHDAGRDARDLRRAHEWTAAPPGRACAARGAAPPFRVLVTTYDVLLRDGDVLGAVAWGGVVVDEAHRLRNARSRLLDALRRCVRRGRGAPGPSLPGPFFAAPGPFFAVLLTGTPLQNDTDELWTLLNFLEPASPAFGDGTRDAFRARFGAVDGAGASVLGP